MADFREEIKVWERNNTKRELRDAFEERTGERPTSYNPLCEVMFRELAPEHTPIDYASRSEEFSDDLDPVGKRSLGLAILLHERIGHPPHDMWGGTITNRLYAKCIVAFDANTDQEVVQQENHVPTDLPEEVDSSPDIPHRSGVIEPDVVPIANFDDRCEQVLRDWLDQNSDLADSESFVYVLNCTPPKGHEEPAKVTHKRSMAKAKLIADQALDSLDPVDQAAIALNQNKSLIYVGKADDLLRRMKAHNAGSGHHGIKFTHVYRPRSILKIHGCSSSEEAERLEGELARELNSGDKAFVYSENM
ncbi:GIY-YIG nuclease family protein [Natronomonas gomsonensis]|uniref:GIY-YIG nuclease family protein n=1 Tax=Natronomonas gomsonensis TaxID=1046043 RepID=UPI0020CA2E79|nr:GIY-YIG nuclease family protein [Natronomonas gomsonensis]MCY4729968.1 GIY-YIG nuclease family protein [Natronomonas gomsonensis]